MHPFGQCRWIGAESACQSPMILRRFTAEQPQSATLHITGLGYFIPRLNGQPITLHRFQPVCSEYSRRDLEKFLYPLHDEITARIYYCTYEVGHLVQKGENILSIQLGNGWYRQEERIAEGHMSYGDTLKTIYCLTLRYPDREERILSDGSETWQESHILYNNLFIGEIHDLRPREASVHPAAVLPDDPAILSPQTGTPDTLIETRTPLLLHLRNGRRIYDAGENISGVVRLTAASAAGQQITLRFAEELTPEGELDFGSTGSSYTCASEKPHIQTDVCICGDTPQCFEPLFCWHAFRYFEIEGPGEDPEVLIIHADTPVISTFCSDSEGLNFLYQAFLRTQLNNMHGSIPSDCPHRERLGYTGDGQVAAAAAMMTLDCREFYRKWMQDILDTQDPVSGHVQHTAPLGGGGGGPVGWGGAIAVVPYRYYKQYGDTAPLEEAWESIRKWIRYIHSRMDGFLVTREEPLGWCLGDWVTLEPVLLPEPFVNTCLFIRYLDMLTEVAPVLGKEADIPHFRWLQEHCREAVNSAYFQPETGHFLDGCQGADAYGLHAGLGDQRTKRLLAEKYASLGHFDTGFIGTDVLLEELFRMGAPETAYKLLSSEDTGSFLYMKRHGATTIWETWNGNESHDHPMFGGCVRHLFEGFLGIRQAYSTGGYRDISVEPFLPEAVTHMEGSLETPVGTVKITLRRENGTVRKEILMP